MKQLLMLIILFSITGCASVGTKITQEQITRIEKGKTTKQEVIQLLGKPTMITTTSDTTVLVYIHSVAKNTVGNFIPVYNVIHTEVKSDTETFSITFDNQDVVKDYSLSQTTMPVSAGLIP